MTTQKTVAEQGVDCSGVTGNESNDRLGTPAPKPSLGPYPDYIPDTVVPRPPRITDEPQRPQPQVEQNREYPPPPKEIPSECLLLSEGLPRDALMANIVRALDDSGAGRSLDASQRDNVLAAAYRSFVPAVDHVGVYSGQLVGTRAPHGLGTEPMDNIPVSIAGAKEVPAQATLAVVEREQEMRVTPTLRMEDEQRGLGARTV
jgi:hypothetical protein